MNSSNGDDREGPAPEILASCPSGNGHSAQAHPSLFTSQAIRDTAGMLKRRSSPNTSERGTPSLNSATLARQVSLLSLTRLLLNKFPQVIFRPRDDKSSRATRTETYASTRESLEKCYVRAEAGEEIKALQGPRSPKVEEKIYRRRETEKPAISRIILSPLESSPRL
jgi:hypothetical protein